MPVYEVRFLLQAETQEAAREAIRVPQTPHTEPILSQWGYHSQIDEETAGVYQSTLLSPGSKIAKQDIPQGHRSRKPRADRGKPKPAHVIEAMRAGRAKALAERRALDPTWSEKKGESSPSGY